MSHRDRHLGFACKRTTAGEGFVRDDSERVNVCSGGCGVTAGLFRREVLNSSHHLTGCRQRHLVGNTRNTKVGDLDAALGRDEEVAGLDIAVNKPCRMGSLKCGRSLRDHVENAIGIEDSFAFKNGTERFARDEFHDEVGAALFLAVVEDVGDAFVVDEGSMTCFSTEPLKEPGVAKILILEDLNRDRTTDNEVCGFPHLAHSADRYATGQLVSATESESTGRSHLFSTASST